MTTPRHPSIQDIDFGQLYRDHMAVVGGAKPPSVWDARADGIKPPSASDPYTQAFVQRMDLSGCETLLDVGCGAGNIALAVAPSLRTVVGLDYSPCRWMLTTAPWTPASPLCARRSSMTRRGPAPSGRCTARAPDTGA